MVQPTLPAAVKVHDHIQPRAAAYAARFCKILCHLESGSARVLDSRLYLEDTSRTEVP